MQRKIVQKIHYEMAPKNSFTINTLQDWVPHWHHLQIEILCDGNQSWLFYLNLQKFNCLETTSAVTTDWKSVPTCSCLVKNQCWGSCRNTCAWEWEGCAAPRRHLQDWAGRMEIKALPSAPETHTGESVSVFVCVLVGGRPALFTNTAA